MVLHPDPLLDCTRMHKHLSPRPPYQCWLKRDLSSERLASTDLQLVSGSPVPTPTQVLVVWIERRTALGHQFRTAADELENFFEFF